MARRLRWPYVLPLLLLPLMILAAGCNRAMYRHKADGEVYQLVECASTDPRWPMDDFTIDPHLQSRMFDPMDPDCPPMPPDDPAAHRLMHCVDCKEGHRCWHANGDTVDVENPRWREYLPGGEDGAVQLDMAGAMALGRLHSTELQSELENLYLSALDVTFERFRFDTQFFGGLTAMFTSDGRDRPGSGSLASSQLDVSVLDPTNRLRAERLLAGGGEMVVGLANSLVWEFSGPNTHSASTLLDFNIVQPLLRAGGRARVMERLTIAERTLLANVRQMERFRRGFYVEIVTGRDAGPGPSRRGGFFGGSGLEGFQGVGGGGFGRIGQGPGGGGGGQGIAGGAGAEEARGFMGLLQEAQQIRNQKANVAGIRDSLAQLQAAHDAGRIDRFQVDLARQALYNAQSQLITRKANYEGRLDDFKVDLGLPPDLAVRIDDPLLDQFQLIHPAVIATQDQVDRFLNQLRAAENGPAEAVPPLDQALEIAAGIELDSRQHLDLVHDDFQRLMSRAPARRTALQRLGQRAEVAEGEVADVALDVSQFDWRLDAMTQDLDQLRAEWRITTGGLDALGNNASLRANPDAAHEKLVQLMTRLSGHLLELSLIQARARLDAVVLTPLELTPDRALAIALTHRRDWMNAQATLVDTWRLIEFNADDLEAGLDVTFSGELGNIGDNPLRLNDSTGRLRAGLAFDAPLTRLAERNVYRQVLIEYQQARRQFYRLRDRIYQGLRNTLRTVRLNELNMELRRAAVHVAISQVDLARLRLARPPQPGETSQFGDTTARDLVQALSDLLSVQNDFLSVWVNYEVQRLGLDFDLGTMQLDAHGMWLDPGSEIGMVQVGPDAGQVIPPEVLPVFPPPPLEGQLPDPSHRDNQGKLDYNP